MKIFPLAFSQLGVWKPLNLTAMSHMCSVYLLNCQTDNWQTKTMKTGLNTLEVNIKQDFYLSCHWCHLRIILLMLLISVTNGEFGFPWTNTEEKLMDQIAKSEPIVSWLSLSELRYDWYLFQASNEKFCRFSQLWEVFFHKPKPIRKKVLAILLLLLIVILTLIWKAII